MPKIDDKEDASKIEAERMFNLAENIIMRYMSEYLNIPADKLFKQFCASNTQKPLILNPIKEYSNKYLEFSLDIVPYDYKLELPKILEDNKEINYIVGFIYHSIITVFNAILKSNICDDKMIVIYNAAFYFELDDNNLAFYPIYNHPPRRMKNMLLQMKSDLEAEMRVKPSNELSNQYSQLLAHINSINYDDEAADKDELKVNNDIKKSNRIGIIFKELDI